MKKIKVNYYGKHDGEFATVSYSLAKTVVERVSKVAKAQKISKSKLVQEIIEKGLK